VLVFILITVLVMLFCFTFFVMNTEGCDMFLVLKWTFSTVWPTVRIL